MHSSTIPRILACLVLFVTIAFGQFFPRENDFAVTTDPFGSLQSTEEYVSAPASMQVAAPWLVSKSTGWPYFVNAPVWFADTFPEIPIRITCRYKYGHVQDPTQYGPEIYVMVMKDAAAADQNGRFVGRAYLKRRVRNTEWQVLDTVITDIRTWIDPQKDQTIGELHTGGNVQLTLCFQPDKSSLFIDDLTVTEAGATSIRPLTVARAPSRPALGPALLFAPNGRALAVNPRVLSPAMYVRADGNSAECVLRVAGQR